MSSPPVAPEPFDALDWSASRAEAFTREVLAIWVDLLKRLDTLPVAPRDSAEEVRAGLLLEVPDEALPDAEVLEHLRALTMRWSTYCGHPRFMGYISGPGTVPGAAAALLEAALNQNAGAWRLSPGGTEIEQALVRWLVARLGLPEGAGGLVMPGGALATLTALKLARDAAPDVDVRAQGVAAAGAMTVYVTEETHAVVERAVDTLGLGRRALRVMPAAKGTVLDPDWLDGTLREDVNLGCKPMAVVATAGTVQTGAIDPLATIAEVCQARGVWLHVDAAYGGAAAMVTSLKSKFAGLERADSVALDAHKWLYTPQTGGLLLVQDPRRLKDSFSARPAYTYQDRTATGRGVDHAMMGPQFSRSLSALKIWVSLLAHGWSAYASRIEHDVALARYLYDRVVAHPDFEPAGGAPELSIVCFRFAPQRMPRGRRRRGYFNRLNKSLLTRLQLDGRTYISNAVVHGRFCLRACIANFRTEAADLDRLLEVVSEVGHALDEELRGDDSIRPGHRSAHPRSDPRS